MRVIEDIDWSALRDAYGPAVEVPSQLRGLASPEVAVARRALGDLEAGILHQGSFYPATAPAVPFLVDAVAAAAPPVKAEVALLLADLAVAHPTAPMAFEPWVFRATPAPPEYPEAVAAVEAVRASREAFVPWLDADEPTLRAAAAFLLSGLDGASLDALAARLTVEADERVRATLHLGLAGHGRRRDDDARTDLEREVLAATRALAGHALDGDLARLEALSLRPWEERAAFPFHGGDLCALACTALLTLARDRRDEVFAAARRALDLRLARGERVVDPPAPRSNRLSDPYPSPPRVAWDPRPGAALGALVRVLAILAFGDRVDDPALLPREALDADQRAVLALTAEYGIPVPVRGAPWIGASAMRRFLTGGGALDRALTLDGVTAPVLHHLLPRDEGDADAERVARVAAALAPEDRLEVIEDILSGAYADGGGTVLTGHLLDGLVASLAPHLDALAPRLEAYAARCADRVDAVDTIAARLALAVFLRDQAVPPPAWDPLVARAVSARPEAGREWLSRFPEARQARIAARAGSPWVFDTLAPASAPDELDRAIMERFLDPACDWMTDDAEAMLDRVDDLQRLLDARASAEGRRWRALDGAIRERTGEGHYTLRLSLAAEGIDAELLDADERALASATVPRAPRAPDLEALAAPITDRARAVVSLAGDLDRTTRYTVQRHLCELGVGEVRDGRSTMRRG